MTAWEVRLLRSPGVQPQTNNFTDILRRFTRRKLGFWGPKWPAGSGRPEGLEMENLYLSTQRNAFYLFLICLGCLERAYYGFKPSQTNKIFKKWGSERQISENPPKLTKKHVLHRGQDFARNVVVLIQKLKLDALLKVCYSHGLAVGACAVCCGSGAWKRMFRFFLIKRDQTLWLLRGCTLNLLWGGFAIGVAIFTQTLRPRKLKFDQSFCCNNQIVLYKMFGIERFSLKSSAKLSNSRRGQMCFVWNFLFFMFLFFIIDRTFFEF